MSQTKITIGHVPVNRGTWSSNTRYYKDNIVQYFGRYLTHKHKNGSELF